MGSRIVVVGCSWDGLSALGEVLSRLEAGDVPVVIAQHRREGPSELARILDPAERLGGARSQGRCPW